MALPFNNWINGESLHTVIYELFCDVSIVFVGISFTIVSLNDFINEPAKRDKESWVMLNIILLLVGAILYAILLIRKNEKPDIEMEKIFGINLIYFIIMLILSAITYIKKMSEVE